MLARLIRSPELRWHTPFVLVAATAWLLARPVVTGVLLVGTAVSLTLMLVGRHASQRESSAVAARYPSAVAHFRMDLLPDSRDEQAPPGSRLRPVELVITPDGLVLLAWRTFEVIHELSWEQVDGVAGYDTAVGSTPAETVVLALAGPGGRTVELRTFAAKALVSNHIVLARPAHLPWPAREIG
ncbi:MAG: hypothetical protein HHJ10_12535 [Cellulomonas sp.]|uniref:hypothetical protein n=1 Tax=Cellulomonas sp. TaxID=40001 RepID=UPI0017998CD6|nr:hypothetical protein [Cellulomonas sp.]NMM31829.1 hypothetical protein [Cellulomonas sp.]